jgi:hypothetical protein
MRVPLLNDEGARVPNGIRSPSDMPAGRAGEGRVMERSCLIRREPHLVHHDLHVVPRAGGAACGILARRTTLPVLVRVGAASRINLVRYSITRKLGPLRSTLAWPTRSGRGGRLHLRFRA